MIYIGGENILSPAGLTMAENILNLELGNTRILPYQAGFNKEIIWQSAFTNKNEISFEKLMLLLLEGLDEKIDCSILKSPSTCIILSSTKGDLKQPFERALAAPLKFLATRYKNLSKPVVVSNACTSGVVAINLAADLIAKTHIENVIVIGIDQLADFITFGFQSLFALSSERCKPFDIDRNGINLGEAAACVVLSKNQHIFKTAKAMFIAGATANDANHISGPSRTGEGLFRSVRKTLAKARLNANQVDYISAHGTATTYNDEMEAIAFGRLGMEAIPINSMKGFYGHTLGAAGVLETAICMHSLATNHLFNSWGFSNIGTSVPLNIVTENKKHKLEVILKTASGFGGSNASLLLASI